MRHPCILTIAGSDSGGGAGIQADLKTIAALRGYGLSVITALTAQNTLGVAGIHAPEPAFVGLQLSTVLEDFPIAAAKTGMLFSREIMDVVAEHLAGRSFPLVVDPVCVSQSGHALLRKDALEALRDRIVSQADVLTPNRPEAEALTQTEIATENQVVDALVLLSSVGAKSVLIKGGHFEGQGMVDWLMLPDGEVRRIERNRIATTATHGTGCTLSAAIAAFLGRGMAVFEAVTSARDYLQGALENASALGRGAGPVNHLWMSQGVPLCVDKPTNGS